MPPAARVTDVHVCPRCPAGPIAPPGDARVIIGYCPAARVGDAAACAGPPDPLVRGEPTVLIAHRPAVRIGDPTGCGGTVTTGCPTVLIGEWPGTSALLAAARDGAPFCEDARDARADRGGGGA